MCVCVCLPAIDARLHARRFRCFQDTSPYRKNKELECLQRALKIADVCMQQSCQLFVHILDRYVYFFEHRCPSVCAPRPARMFNA